MFRKRTKDPLYCFKDLRKKVKEESVNYGAREKAYRDKETRWDSICIWLAVFIPRIIDYNMRLWDFWRNRSCGGRLERIGIRAHSPVALILPLGLLYFLFFGPSGGHWEMDSTKWILSVVLPIIVLVSRLLLKRYIILEAKVLLRLFDVVRWLMWSLFIVFVVVGFSRGPFVHAWLMLFAILLWAVFACGSQKDEGGTPRSRRFPWIIVIYLLGGLGSFYVYIRPLGYERGTGPVWFLVYLSVIALIFLIPAGLFMRNNKEEWQRYGSWALWGQLGIVMVAGWVVWFFGGLREADPGIYQHVLVPLTVVMLVVPLAIASLIARIIFRFRIRMVGSCFHHLLQRVEVFGSPDIPPLNANRVFRSLLVTLRHVLMLLFPPALAVVLTPYYLRGSLKWVGLAFLVLTFMVIAYAKIHDRLGYFIAIYRGMFFHGLQVVVSILVIALGITRLADIGYVSYVVEASPLTLLTFVLVAYLVLWLLEYWINRVFAEEFLSLLNPENRACGWVKFGYDNDDAYRESMRVRVKAKNRKVQLHGNGRIVVVGERQWFENNPTVYVKQPGNRAERENCVVVEPAGDGFSIRVFDENGKRLENRDRQLSDQINRDPEAVAVLEELWKNGEDRPRDLLAFLEMQGVIDLKDEEEKERETQRKKVDEEKGRSGTRFQFYNKFDLLDHLVENAILSDFDYVRKSCPRGDKDGEMVVREKAAELRNQLRWHVQDLRKQYVSYYAMLTMVLVSGILFQVLSLTSIVDPTALPSFSQQEAIPVAAAGTPVQAPDLFSLREQLFEKAEGHAGSGAAGTGPETLKTTEPVILLAASGGGTRAALYTASVLHGLAELGQLDNVKFVSGVSGGGAALAYFYAHRDWLLEGVGEQQESWEERWADFYNTVSEKYIVRCLKGSAERRVAGGVRLGVLLNEGFQDCFFEGDDPRIGGGEIGILFNTAVAGEVHPPSSSNIDVALYAQKNPRRTKSWAAGTRLVISNILEVRDLKGVDDVSRDGLRYTTVVQPNISLSTAAALNANFPPVFSNAPVDIDGQRYWVTDGGAVDNRGVITLLYVLKAALLDQAERVPRLDEREGGTVEEGFRADPTNSSEPEAGSSVRTEHRFIYPDIHIIVADASATSFDYTSKRGLGAMFASSRKLATGLINELHEEVQEIYGRIHGEKKEKIHIHNLAMPLSFRARGGLGTHWMMPLMATFKSCKTDDPIEDKKGTNKLRLTRNQILSAVARLHQPDSQDDIAQLVTQDPLLLRLLCKKGDLDKFVSWYDNDAAYLRGYTFYDEQADETEARSHPEAWEAIKNAISKQ